MIKFPAHHIAAGNQGLFYYSLYDLDKPQNLNGGLTAREEWARLSKVAAEVVRFAPALHALKLNHVTTNSPAARLAVSTMGDALVGARAMLTELLAAKANVNARVRSGSPGWPSMRLNRGELLHTAPQAAAPDHK